MLSSAFSLLLVFCYTEEGLPRWFSVKESAWQWRHRFSPWDCPLKEEMATHSSILAWDIPWTEEPVSSRRVGHDLVTEQQQQRQ